MNKGVIRRGLAVAAIFVAVLALWFYAEWHRVTEEPIPLEGDAVTFEIVSGQSLSSIADRLEELDVLRNARDLTILARLRGVAGKVQAGEYRVEPGMTTAEVLERLVSGNVVLHSLTIVEGWTFDELMRAVRNHDALEHTLGDAGGREVMAKLGRPDTHPEGQFLPETYRFPKGLTDLKFLRRAHEALREALEKAWSERDKDLPIDSAYEALILASIVEKETAVPEERRRIAGVFVRRLNRGMRLQTDPTVIYGMGDAYDGDIRFRDLKRDTAYNTYTRHGLPPTPIALAGRASIEAAVHPAPGDALYFVAKDDGTHHFSSTLAEHNRAVRKYQLER